MMRVVADVPSATLVVKEKTPNNLNNFHLYKSDNNTENVPENHLIPEYSQVSSTISEYDDNYMCKKDQVIEIKNDNDNNNENEFRKFPSPFISSCSRRKGRTSILFPALKESISPLLSPEQNSNLKCRNSASRRMTLSPATARSLILEVMEEKEEKENKEKQGETLLNRDKQSFIGITSPQPHLPLLLSSPLPFSLSTLTSNSPLLMPLYPPLNSPPANFPLVVMNPNHKNENENDKTTFDDVINTSSLVKEIEKTKNGNGRISNKTAMMNFKILADQKIKIMNEEKEKNILLFENDKRDIEGEEKEVTDLIDMSDLSAQAIIVIDMTETEMISTSTIDSSNDQSLPQERFLVDEECSDKNILEETISMKMELSNEVLCQNTDENKNQNKDEMSEDIVCEELNDKEFIIVTERKVMKNLAYHDELNALLDSDSDISTSISPVRPAYPATATSNDPVDCSPGIFHADLDLTNGSDSSPVGGKDPSTDTEISCTVCPHQSTTSPGRFLEMTYLSESTEDSFHTFLSLSEGLISENENDVVIDDLDGNTILLNNSLIAVAQSSTIRQMNNNNEYNHKEKSIITTSTTISEQIDDTNMKMDVIQMKDEKVICSSDTTVLVRKRVEEYSERNEIVKKSKMEKVKTSLSCRTIDTLKIIENGKNVPGNDSMNNGKNVPGNDSMDVSLLDVAEKENNCNCNIVNMITQQADTIAVVDLTTLVHDVGIVKQSTPNKQLMNTTSNNNNNNDEILVEVTLENARDRAIGRMNIRNEIVKWKYGWEIASFCAAQVARQRLALLPPF